MVCVCVNRYHTECKLVSSHSESSRAAQHLWSTARNQAMITDGKGSRVLDPVPARKAHWFQWFAHVRPCLGCCTFIRLLSSIPRRCCLCTHCFGGCGHRRFWTLTFSTVPPKLPSVNRVHASSGNTVEHPRVALQAAWAFPCRSGGFIEHRSPNVMT